MSSPPSDAVPALDGPHGDPGGRAARVGLLGGTFDPPHCGHLAAAAACRQALGLDRILLVVANDPWQKAERSITPAEDRWAMVAAAAATVPGVEASRLEIDRGGTTYTVDTVEQLLAEARAAGLRAPDIFLVVGADLVGGLSSWSRVDELQRLVRLVVVSRPRSPAVADPPGWRVAHVDGGAVDVSSSEVRELLEAGAAVDGLVPEEVVRCIRRRGLYAVAR